MDSSREIQEMVEQYDLLLSLLGNFSLPDVLKDRSSTKVQYLVTQTFALIYS